MPDESKRSQPPAVTPDDPVPVPDDPGGAHAKGYSAEPGSGPPVDDDTPVPLAPAPDGSAAIHVPERDNDVRPTGRGEPGKWPAGGRTTGPGR